MSFFNRAPSADVANPSNSPVLEPKDAAESKPKEGNSPKLEEDRKFDLDAFAKLIDNNATSGDSSKSTPDILELLKDDNALNGLAAQVSPLAGLPEDVLNGLQQGVAAAIMKAIELSGQNAYKKAIKDSVMLAAGRQDAEAPKTEAAIQKALKNARFETDVSSVLDEGTPPATRLMLNAIADKLHTANPKASNKDIAKQAKAILAELGQSVAPSPKDPRQAPVKTNWKGWLGA